MDETINPCTYQKYKYYQKWYNKTADATVKNCLLGILGELVLIINS